MSRTPYTGQAHDLGPLFSPERLARTTDPATSKAAAATAEPAVRGEAVEVLRALVAYRRDHGQGGTSRQIAAHASTDPGFRFVVAKRLTVLEFAGLARRAGDIIDPDTGRRAEVWEPTTRGKEKA